MWLLFETIVPPSSSGKMEFYLDSLSFICTSWNDKTNLSYRTNLATWIRLEMTVNQGGGQEILDICHVWHLRCDDILFWRIFAGLSLFSEAKRVKAWAASSFVCSVLIPGEGVTKHCFMTIMLISFLTFRKNMCTEWWNTEKSFFLSCRIYPCCGLNFDFSPFPPSPQSVVCQSRLQLVWSVRGAPQGPPRPALLHPPPQLRVATVGRDPKQHSGEYPAQSSLIWLHGWVHAQHTHTGGRERDTCVPFFLQMPISQFPRQ